MGRENRENQGNRTAHQDQISKKEESHRARIFVQDKTPLDFLFPLQRRRRENENENKTPDYLHTESVEERMSFLLSLFLSFFVA